MKNKRKQIVIFGAGTTGQRIYYALKDVSEIVGFLDNDETKWGKKIDNISILGNADVIHELSFDEIVICSLTGLQIIREELLLAGVPAEKIRVDYIETQVKARNYFLYDFAKMYYKFWRGGGMRLRKEVFFRESSQRKSIVVFQTTFYICLILLKDLINATWILNGKMVILIRKQGIWV